MKILILNAAIVNEGTIAEKDILVENGLISRIDNDLQHIAADKVIDASGQYAIPGVIDDQVHFREPGLTHKASIGSEARAGVAGGVTSFMEMPNTVPNALTQGLLEDKYQIASQTSLANYSFYMGASNDNYEEVMKTDPTKICGIKIFMGSSTGNMLVDAPETLENLFSNAPTLIAVHCEDEATVKARLAQFKEQFGQHVPYNIHALIRNEEACYTSSSYAVGLAKRTGARLHILHISTGDETHLFEKGVRKNGKIFLENGQEKRITSEACVHHLWFDENDYKSLGNQIKCNPAIKNEWHKAQILQSLLDDRIDVIATDHAPHTWEEKQQDYWQAPSGLPLLQHSLPIMLEFYKQGKISLERIVEKMSHSVADCFQIEKRGYIREGYWADLTLVDLQQSVTVSKDNILYKCGWSPLTGTTFNSVVTHTLVSGHLAYEKGVFHEEKKGQRMSFVR